MTLLCEAVTDRPSRADKRRSTRPTVLQNPELPESVAFVSRRPRPIRIGLQIAQYGADWPALLTAAREAEALGADALFNWDRRADDPWARERLQGTDYVEYGYRSAPSPGGNPAGDGPVLLDLGVTLFIVSVSDLDLDPVRRWVRWRDEHNAR
jgi:hypothetical protein